MIVAVFVESGPIFAAGQTPADGLPADERFVLITGTIHLANGGCISANVIKVTLRSRDLI
jgi:hypothetical protein